MIRRRRNCMRRMETMMVRMLVRMGNRMLRSRHMMMDMNMQITIVVKKKKKMMMMMINSIAVIGLCS